MTTVRFLLLAGIAASSIRAQPLDHLEFLNVKGEMATYRGKSAVHIVEKPGAENGNAVAIVKDADFKDGTIEVEVAGALTAGAADAARGFIGVAFRVQPHGEKYECFYLRPTNGRAQDQLRRNHSAQYVSEPDFPWHRLRKENPGMYETYVDLEPGVWTKMKIVVSGTKLGCTFMALSNRF